VLYKALGFFVWKTVKFYVVQKSPGKAKLALAGAAAVALVLAAGAGTKRQLGSDSSSA
jgi:hypothetical protein